MDLNHNLKKIEITFPNTDQKEIFNITKIFPKSRLMLISNTKAISSNLITNYSFIKVYTYIHINHEKECIGQREYRE